MSGKFRLDFWPLWERWTRRPVQPGRPCAASPRAAAAGTWPSDAWSWSRPGHCRKCPSDTSCSLHTGKRSTADYLSKHSETFEDPQSKTNITIFKTFLTTIFKTFLKMIFKIFFGGEGGGVLLALLLKSRIGYESGSGKTLLFKFFSLWELFSPLNINQPASEINLRRIPQPETPPNVSTKTPLSTVTTEYIPLVSHIFFFFIYTLYYPFREIWAALPG